jgi:hypothetical protein
LILLFRQPVAGQRESLGQTGGHQPGTGLIAWASAAGQVSNLVEIIAHVLKKDSKAMGDFL